MKRSFEVLILLGVVAFIAQMRYAQPPPEALPQKVDIQQISASSEDQYTPPDPNHQNSFTQSNPDYRTRAGKSYEENYLDAATQSLVETCALDEDGKDKVEATLRGFIYRWLDAYVEGGGTRSELTVEAEQWLDHEFRALPAYEAWKKSSDNKLGFLFLAPPKLEPEPSIERGIPR